MTGTAAVHIKLNVTWAASSVLVAGSGVADLWLKSTLTLDSMNNITGTAKPCGATLPDTSVNILSIIMYKIQLKFPDASWENSHMPTYAVTGKQTGVGAGAMQTINASVGLLGLNPSGTTSKYAMSSQAWPAPPPANQGTFPQFMASELSDDDGDGHPGITINPTNGGMYQYPPTQLSTSGNTTDAVYVVSRNTVALSGMLTSCVAGSGTATVSQFDNHVVGCHDAMGTNCASTTSGNTMGPGFVDNNRTIYTPGSATYTAVQIDPGATCAMVRSAI
jgi:hypothetical protein